MAPATRSLAGNRVNKPVKKPVNKPTLEELRLDAQAVGFDLSDAELKAIHAYAEGFLKAAHRVSEATPPPCIPSPE